MKPFPTRQRSASLENDWLDWENRIGLTDVSRREPKRIFLSILFLTFALVFAAACVLVWAVHPRLESLHTSLGDLALAAVTIFTALFLALYASLVGVLLGARPLALAERISHHLFRVFPLVSAVGRAFGMPQSRLGRSLLQVHNEIVQSRVRQATSGRILCLASRQICEHSLEQLTSLIAEYDCEFAAVGSATEARAHIARVQPGGIVGVACHQELIAAIRDHGYHIPVYAVPNRCVLDAETGAHRSAVDFQKLREAIEIFKERFEFARTAAPESSASSSPR